MPPRRRILLLLPAALLAGACGGPSGLRDGVYHGPETSYALAAPEGRWEPLDVSGQNDLAFYAPELDALLQSNSTCSPSQDIPLVALTNHLLIGFTERTIVSQELEPLDGREALRTHLTAKLDGVPRELALVVMKKDGCVYDFALIAPEGEAFARALPSFDAMLASFGTETARR